MHKSGVVLIYVYGKGRILNKILRKTLTMSTDSIFKGGVPYPFFSENSISSYAQCDRDEVHTQLLTWFWSTRSDTLGASGAPKIDLKLGPRKKFAQNMDSWVSAEPVCSPELTKKI